MELILKELKNELSYEVKLNAISKIKEYFQTISPLYFIFNEQQL